MADESIIANLKSEGFKELINDLTLSSKGFSELDKSISEAQKKLATLDKTSQEFKDLTKEINAATIAANAYAESTDTLKNELRDTTNEIGQLEKAIKALDKAGEQNSQTYKDLVKQQDTLKKKAGELKNTVGDLNAEIKNSGSDTKNLDKALRAVNTVAAGYQAAQGALVLFGGENKKFEQTLLKLNAVMAITQGLQQIQEELSKKDSIFTLAAAKAKQAYTFAVAQSTTALGLFRLALAATGIGLAIIGIYELYKNWDKLKEAIGLSTISLEDYRKVNEKILEIEEKRNKARELGRKLDVLTGKKTEVESERESVTDLIEDYNKLDDAYVKQSKKLKELKSSVGGGGFFKSLFGQSREDAIDEQEKIVSEIVIKRAEALEKTLSATKVFNGKIDKDNEKISIESAKREKEKQDNLLKEYELRQKLSEKNLQALLEALNAENKLYNKYRQEREKQAEQSAANEKQIRLNEIEIANTTNEKYAKDRLEKNKQLNDELAEQNRQRQDEDLEAERKHAEKVAFILQTLAGVADAIGNIASQAISIRSQRELKELEDRKNKGLISEKRFEKESAKIKTEAAKKQRAADIAIATAKIPLIFLQALVSAPFPFGLILASIASGIALAEVAILAASPLPQFKKGGQVSKELGLIKGKSHAQGGVPIEVEGDEYVMPVKETKENLPALEAMRKGKFHELFIPKQNVMQPDVFANIPNPAMLDIPVMMDKDDYSSINQRLDKLANEMWWLSEYTKQGNKARVQVGEKVVKNLENQKRRYV